jgi:hypothetical protein
MSRIKFVVIVVVLFVVAIIALPAAAAAPIASTCMPSCWASNHGSASGNGTYDRMQLWLYYSNASGLHPTASDLRNLVGNEAAATTTSATLVIYNCGTNQSATCPATQYIYSSDGTETHVDIASFPVPPSGVSLPAPFLLGGALAIAAVLILFGFGLRLRAQRSHA